MQLVKVGGKGAVWEGGNDREFKALGPDFGLRMACKWDHTSEASVESFKVLEASVGAGGASHSQVSQQQDQPAQPIKQQQAVAAGGSNGSVSYISETENWIDCQVD